MKELHLCLNQLVLLYDRGLPGAVNEFAAYRLLFLLLKVSKPVLWSQECAGSGKKGSWSRIPFA